LLESHVIAHDCVVEPPSPPGATFPSHTIAPHVFDPLQVILQELALPQSMPPPHALLEQSTVHGIPGGQRTLFAQSPDDAHVM
jgi:hypothetical protein